MLRLLCFGFVQIIHCRRAKYAGGQMSSTTSRWLALLQISWWCGTLFSAVSAEMFLPPLCNPALHNTHEVLQSAQAALEILSKLPAHGHKYAEEPRIQNRLAVMMLFGQGFLSSSSLDRIPYLQCALKKLYKNMLPKTPIDVFIWVPEASIGHVPSWLKNATEYPRTVVMPIVNTTWMVPCGLHDDSLWPLRKHFNVEYHIMGRWRLTFAYDFVRVMGYQYYLQYDDDACLNSFLDFNIVTKFQNSSYKMGVFSDHIGEVAHVALGIAELTRYWMTINKYLPQGTLFNHLTPKNIDGLFSNPGNFGGWDRYYHPGYFLITSIDFWFGDLVQDYLTTILKSGRDVEGRWQEQLVQNMIRLVFIPPGKLWIMNEVDIGHDRHKRLNFENWCIKDGTMKKKYFF